LASSGTVPSALTPRPAWNCLRSTRKKKLTTGQKTANQIIAAARAPVEHGFAALKNWRILTRLRLNPARATTLLRALLVLTNLETTR